MKNLYQYSAKENPTKFVWDKEYSNQKDVTSFTNEKAKLKTEVTNQLKKLGSVINLAAVEQSFESNGNEEVIIHNKNKTVLREKRKGFNNDEKIKIKDGKVKIKQGWLSQADLKVKDINGDGEFDVEEVLRAEGAYKINETEDPVVVIPEIDPVVVVVPEVVEVNETMTGYETEIAALGTGIDSMDRTALTELRTKILALRTKIDGELDENLSVSEKAQLNKQLDDLITRIEAREAVLENIENIDKEKAAREAIDLARDMINSIDLKDLSMENYNDYSGPIDAAKAELMKAIAAAAGLPQFEADIAELQAALDEKENKVEVYETGSKEKERVEKEYKEKTEEELNKQDDEIQKTVDAYKTKLEALGDTPDKLTIDNTPLDPADPDTFEKIQKGMISHRTESMKMIEEVNFLQTCGQKLATKVAKFEEQKSELSFANAGRFIASSLAIIPGTLWDVGEKSIGTGKRAGDRFGWLGFGDSQAEELQKEQVEFGTEFAKKQVELETKKTRLDTYGSTLQTNSEKLKIDAPDQVKGEVQTNIEAQLTAEGLDPTAEPWNGVVEELMTEFGETAIETVGPAVDQLDMQVDGSVPELTEATGISLQAANETGTYIQKLDVHSATILDMSVGFLTKNVAKGLDGIGDVLATNPVTGVVGGLCRAAGGLVEGVGTLITDPLKVGEGLANLVGFGPAGSFSAAWSGLATGFFGAEAFQTGIAKLQEGGFWNAMNGLGEITAGVGEAGGNIIATVFSGGYAAGARGGGLLGNVGKVGRFATQGVSKVSKYIPKTIVNGAEKVGNFAMKTGKYVAKAGNLALAPLKFGLRPLKWLGKPVRKVGSAIDRGLTPTRWAKGGNIKYMRNQKAKLIKESRRLDQLAKGAKNIKMKQAYTKEAAALMEKANKINTTKVVSKIAKKTEYTGEVIKTKQFKNPALTKDAFKNVAKTKEGIIIKTGKYKGVWKETSKGWVKQTAKKTEYTGPTIKTKRLDPFNKVAFEKAAKTKQGVIIKSGKYEGVWTESSNGWVQTVKGGKPIHKMLPPTDATNLTKALQAAWRKQNRPTSLVSSNPAYKGVVTPVKENLLYNAWKRQNKPASSVLPVKPTTTTTIAPTSTVPPVIPAVPAVRSKWARGGAGIVTPFIPASYATAEMEKNKNQELKDDVVGQFENDEFEPTPLANIGTAPVAAAVANGATTSVNENPILSDEMVNELNLDSYYDLKRTPDQLNTDLGKMEVACALGFGSFLDKSKTMKEGQSVVEDRIRKIMDPDAKITHDGKEISVDDYLKLRDRDETIVVTEIKIKELNGSELPIVANLELTTR